ncbi:uncharacterized protein LOC122991827 isoform X2 [Thunnus albacares]|uniref:uncharacterized protein LOC122991827 isoform X2 n=1 Tax=Thunnus albacares TaxID=8236 RepID=UPI001CF682D0|nr:uncharacterized protein LOC122991827 isoform X2 [Thunnus albacares]
MGVVLQQVYNPYAKARFFTLKGGAEGPVGMDGPPLQGNGRENTAPSWGCPLHTQSDPTLWMISCLTYVPHSCLLHNMSPKGNSTNTGVNTGIWSFGADTTAASLILRVFQDRWSGSLALSQSAPSSPSTPSSGSKMSPFPMQRLWRKRQSIMTSDTNSTFTVKEKRWNRKMECHLVFSTPNALSTTHLVLYLPLSAFQTSSQKGVIRQMG